MTNKQFLLDKNHPRNIHNFYAKSEFYSLSCLGEYGVQTDKQTVRFIDIDVVLAILSKVARGHQFYFRVAERK